MEAVVHHLELCVQDCSVAVEKLQTFGFRAFANRTTSKCKQVVTKLGKNNYFLITERQEKWKCSKTTETEEETFPSLICCEYENSHEIDSVFNISLNVKNVEKATKTILDHGGSVIVPPKIVRDEFGEISVSVVRSCCGNVVHTLLNKSNYKGSFLPGFVVREDNINSSEPEGLQKFISHVDHVTLACPRGDSQRIISFYEKCFGMQSFSMSRDYNEDTGLILAADGVGLRLRAMEYYRCDPRETGLIYPKSKNREKNSVMLVVVESVQGQTDCNIETFLREHMKPGIEHVAFSTTNICEVITAMSSIGCQFRQPPKAYYTELQKMKEIESIGVDLSTLQRLGILLDNEAENNETPRYLMQIFSQPIFSRKTFFIEVIERNGAKGLGAGNILALVRCIREEEKRKLNESKKQEMKEEIINLRRVC